MILEVMSKFQGQEVNSETLHMDDSSLRGGLRQR